MGICAEGWLIWLLAIGSSTPRAALLLSLIAAVVCLIVRLCMVFCRTTAVSVLLGIGITAILYSVAQRWFPSLSFSPMLWIATAVFAAAVAHDSTAHLPYHTVPVLLLVGGVREILAQGSLWGIVLLPMELSSAFTSGVGGWLIAATVLWLCRLSPPLFRQNDTSVPLIFLGGATAVGSLIGLFTAAYPAWITLWGAFALCAVCLAVLPTNYTADCLIAVVPFAAWWTRETENQWLPLLLAIGTICLLRILIELVRYRRLSTPAPHFVGVPSALTVSAMVYGLTLAAF